ncbi:MAG: DUF6285 domain-containing protein [Pseudomonadota bacterium]
MRDRPQGHELLVIAAKTFREEILPVLPDEKKYAALMILNALSIAERQQAIGEGPLNDECDLLEVLLDVSPQASELHARAAELNREFARRVRVGAYDDDDIGRHVLWALTLQRVRESAPRYLKAEGIE